MPEDNETSQPQDVESNVQPDEETVGSDEQASQSPAEELGDAGSSSSASAPPEEIPELPDFSGMLTEAAAGSIELLNDVEVNVKIELGRAEMTVEEILHLTTGSVVELDKLAGDPVDILVNEQLIARGEVLVVNDNFCVRIHEIVPGVSERAMKSSHDKTGHFAVKSGME